MPSVTKQVNRPVAKAKSPVDRIKSIAEIDEEEGIKILLYGKSATGKTTLWSSFPGPILVMVCSGTKTGELLSVNTPELRKKISRITLEGVDDVRPVIDHVAETGKYKTLVLDHATGLQDLTLKEILGLDELPAQKPWGMATQQQYGQSTLQCKEIFRSMVNLPGNVVIIAQERQFGGGDDANNEFADVITPTIGAAMTPSLVGWLNPAVDYICQTFIRPKYEVKEGKVGNKTIQMRKRVPGVEYCLRVEPHDVFTTKFRVPKGHKIPSVIVDPTYDKIMKIIRGQSL